ncbi:MAG: hypothetical protein ACYTHK_15325 [Planctomycetota bacterium]|jgi:hypothetical protein
MPFVRVTLVNGGGTNGDGHAKIENGGGPSTVSVTTVPPGSSQTTTTSQPNITRVHEYVDPEVGGTHVYVDGKTYRLLSPIIVGGGEEITEVILTVDEGGHAFIHAYTHDSIGMHNIITRVLVP